MAVAKVENHIPIGVNNVSQIHFVDQFECVYQLETLFTNSSTFLNVVLNVCQTDDIFSLRACKDNLQTLAPIIVSRLDTNIKSILWHAILYMLNNQSLH